ncbi:MAG: glycerophosphodiester phosphodiesterase family protein [Elusimicrobiota bacterium]
MRVIAHRGASAYFPENTLRAFRAALDLGAAAVEFDVQQTKDGELVVLHDPELARLSGAPGAVGRLSAAELLRRDVGRWLSPRFAGTRVPLLKEVLDLLLRARVEVHLEVKHGPTPYEGIERRVQAELARRPTARHLTVVSSFHHPSLKALRALDPELRLGWLAGRQTPEEAAAGAADIGCESLHISRQQADARWVRCARAQGLKLLVYTVDDPAEAGRLKALGVEGVFSNQPDLLRPPDKVGGSA